MLFLLSIVYTLVFFLAFARLIKKRPSVFYVLTPLFILLLFASYYTGLYERLPEWFLNYFVMTYARGSLSTAVFAVVMYLGVVPGRWPGAGRLMAIRGEMSIIGSILALGHNIYYGRYYFTHLFTEPSELSAPYIAATIVSLVLMAIMLPLMITSFRCVRRKMRASNWKKLQRLAYVFYALLYVHVLIVLLANIRGASTVVSIAAYSAVFVPYFILRPLKRIRKKRGADRRAAA